MLRERHESKTLAKHWLAAGKRDSLIPPRCTPRSGGLAEFRVPVD